MRTAPAAPPVPSGVPVLDGLGRPHRGGLTAEDVAGGARMDFHGIPPAALRDTDVLRWWPVVSPAYESVCARGLRDRWTAGDVADALATDLVRLRAPEVPGEVLERAARSLWHGGVRSYDQGVLALTAWLMPRLSTLASTVSGQPWSPRPSDRLALQVVREGATSSVVVVTLRRRGGRRLCWVVNVARDASAATSEQEGVAEELRRMAGRGAVSVLEAGEATTPWFGQELPLSVLVVTFANGREVHPLPGGSGPAATRLVLVEEFDDTVGLTVPGFRGRPLSVDDADLVWSQVVRSTLSAASWESGTLALPTVEIGDGDVVAEPGGPVTLVATDGRPWSIPAAWAPYAVALLSARADGGGARLYWGRPEQALAALQEALPEAAAGLRDAARTLDERELDDFAVAHQQRYGDPPPGPLLRQTRRLL